MMIVWSPKSLRWFENASVFTGYHEKLAAMIAEELYGSDVVPEDSDAADLGCGSGLLDFILAGKYRSVTCVDIDDTAIGAVISGARKRSIPNLEAIVGDAATLDRSFDDVLAVFSGVPETFVSKYIPMAKHGFCAVVHTGPEGAFGPERFRMKKCNTAEATEAALKAAGIAYTRRDARIEYGQPFADMDEAADFVKAYSKNPPDEAVDSYLERVLLRTGREDFPLYIPNEKPISLITVKTTDLRR